MTFTLIRAEYDQQTERAYVELRAPDDDGGESVVTTIFSYRATKELRFIPRAWKAAFEKPKSLGWLNWRTY
jgi:hypothetical protein